MNPLSPTSSDSPDYLPLCLKGSNLRCLIIGGGEVAYRKVEQLLSVGAKVTLIADTVVSPLNVLLTDGRFEWIQRQYRDDDVIDFHLVIAATNDPAINHRVARAAHDRHTLVNVVDDPEYCSVIFPAVWREGMLTGAISTGGTAPFLSPELRDRLSRTTAGWGDWLLAAGRFRELVRRKVPDQSRREEFYRRFIALGPRHGIYLPGEEVDPEGWLIGWSQLRPFRKSSHG